MATKKKRELSKQYLLYIAGKPVRRLIASSLELAETWAEFQASAYYQGMGFGFFGNSSPDLEGEEWKHTEPKRWKLVPMENLSTADAFLWWSRPTLNLDDYLRECRAGLGLPNVRKPRTIAEPVSPGAEFTGGPNLTEGS